MDKRWHVDSGDIHEIVAGATAEDAMANVFTVFDDDGEPPSPGKYISASK